MKKIMVFIFIIFVFAAFPLTSFSEGNKVSKDECGKISEEVKNIKIHLENLDRIDRKMTEAKRELEGCLNKKKEDLKRFNEKNTEKVNFTLWILSFLGVTIISLLVSLIVYLINRWCAAKKMIKKMISKQFDLEVEYLDDFIDSLKEDFLLKKNKKMLVLSLDSESQKMIRKFLRRMGFGNIKFEIFNGKNNTEGFDILFFNNHIWEDDTELKALDSGYAKNFLEKNKRDRLFIFYFGSMLSNPQDLGHSLSFATARSQIYGNLMNGLRYQDIF